MAIIKKRISKKSLNNNSDEAKFGFVIMVKNKPMSWIKGPSIVSSNQESGEVIISCYATNDVGGKLLIADNVSQAFFIHRIIKAEYPNDEIVIVRLSDE